MAIKSRVEVGGLLSAQGLTQAEGAEELGREMVVAIHEVQLPSPTTIRYMLTPCCRAPAWPIHWWACIKLDN